VVDNLADMQNEDLTVELSQSPDFFNAEVFMAGEELRGELLLAGYSVYLYQPPEMIHELEARLGDTLAHSAALDVITEIVLVVGDDYVQEITRAFADGFISAASKFPERVGEKLVDNAAGLVANLPLLIGGWLLARSKRKRRTRVTIRDPRGHVIGTLSDDDLSRERPSNDPRHGRHLPPPTQLPE
jgi:hypothetical protein